jgi:hypothetical protein
LYRGFAGAGSWPAPDNNVLAVIPSARQIVADTNLALSFATVFQLLNLSTRRL